MRLVTFSADNEPRAGALVDDLVVDLNAADPSLPPNVLSLIQAGPALLDRARAVASSAKQDTRRPASAVRLHAPIPRPPKIVCIGLNYSDHAAETGATIPARPSTFLKAPSCVVGPNEPIVQPPTTQQLDYEVEFAFAVGRRASRVRAEDAMPHVLGYTILNDVSARDLQFAKDGGIIVGKNFESF